MALAAVAPPATPTSRPWCSHTIHTGASGRGGPRRRLDADGIVLVPADQVEEITAGAAEIAETEAGQADAARKGRCLREQLDFAGYLAERERDLPSPWASTSDGAAARSSASGYGVREGRLALRPWAANVRYAAHRETAPRPSGATSVPSRGPTVVPSGTTTLTSSGCSEGR